MAKEESTTQKLWKNIRGIQFALGLTDERFSEMMGVSSDSYRKLRGKSGKLPVHVVSNLASAIDISFEEFFKDSIDSCAIRASFHKVPEFVPERYSPAAYSKRRNSINVLSYIDLLFGASVKQSFLRKLMISEHAFMHPDECINILFLSDLCAELQKRGCDDFTFFEMGAFSVVTNQSSPVSKPLRREKTVKALYERAFTELMVYFDLNHDYRIASLTDNQVTVKIDLRDQVTDGLSQRLLGNLPFCQVRGGVGASLPGYIGLPYSKEKLQKCIHLGDPYCMHTFDFSEAAWFEKRIRQPEEGRGHLRSVAQ